MLSPFASLSVPLLNDQDRLPFTGSHLLFGSIIGMLLKNLWFETTKYKSSFTSDLLEGVHALGEDVVTHDAHYDRNLEICILRYQRTGIWNKCFLSTYRGINKGQGTVL